MTKKQLEKHIEQLEKELSELKSAMLAFSLIQKVTFIPQPYPVYLPLPQPVYGQQQITPWSPQVYPIITCQATSGRTQ
jgi:hypothetical protein